MMRGGRLGIIAVSTGFVLALAVTLGGCTPRPDVPLLTPRIAPPLIHEAGVLRVGVDLSYPPFGGIVAGRQAGIDVDVASALAGRLGLKTGIVDVRASEIASALADGSIDVGLSAPFSAEVLSRATIAGTYLTDGPALFATQASMSITPTSPASTLDGVKLAGQQDSDAYWRLVNDHGTGAVASYPTLREALTALVRGDVTAVGGDALVGAYIARDYPKVRFVGALADPKPLGAAVSADNSRLADIVRSTLDSLAADGVLDAIRTTWVGNLPKLPTGSDDASASTTSAPIAP